ncbi:tetratricopeptide repeat protein [Kutzneria sp. CA-103260]|uniref:tetratricopeptide repeat protein n=1 Tax=Kutzneria sp. CA-103260 TaxID=2802641 RepID=UPI001BA59002|nr:tetratricopeptide repeat protein [Kutzneria sp. CA-103260]
MRLDQHGISVHAATAAAVDELDGAVDSLLHFRTDVGERSERAVTEDPLLPTANAMRVYLAVLSTDPQYVPPVRAKFAEFRQSAGDLTVGEHLHVEAAAKLLDGDLHAAGSLLADLTAEQPRDALALAVGHQIDFLTGDATSLRDRIGGALPAWTPADPHYANLLGMYAFGLEECGHWELAEQTGLRAMELDAADVWSIHAVGHTHEMRANYDDGIAMLDRRRSDWDRGNLLRVHIWWHYCLFLLEAGRHREALGVYDERLAPTEESTITEVVNAASLMWRLHLLGEDVGDRWAKLAATWPPRMTIPFNAFNDMHAVMSYVGAGEDNLAADLIADRRRYVGEAGSSASPATNVAMTARVGLPICEALLAFGRGRYTEAVDLLWPIRRHVHEFGGSHAQRDVMQRTLVEAAIRAGRTAQARTLIGERISVRPDSPYNQLKMRQLADS